MYIPPTYPLLRKLPDNVLQQNKGENQERGRHGIQEKEDPTQEGSEGKSQAESCTAGLKSRDWSRRTERSSREVSGWWWWGGYGL